MPRETFRRLKPAKKQQVIAGLTTVFTRLGYDKATVADIVKTCGIPRGSFYQYFNHKYDAFLAVIDEAQHKKMAYLDGLIKRIGQEPFFDLYYAMVDAGIAFAKAHPDYVAVWVGFFASRDPGMQSAWRDFEHRSVTLLETYLRKDQAAGFIRNDVNTLALSRLLYRFQSIDIMDAFLAGKSVDEMQTMARQTIDIIRHDIEEETHGKNTGI